MFTIDSPSSRFWNGLRILLIGFCLKGFADGAATGGLLVGCGTCSTLRVKGGGALSFGGGGILPMSS